MIARMWRGYALPEKADDYARHLQMSVLPELRQIDGFQGVKLMRQDSPEDVEFIVLTFWESMDAIRRFAGDDPEVAVVAPAAQALFRKYDSTVRHFEVVLNIQ
ncbi:MAG TPA: antibiotic biosynthesis monooxygenase [Anaerolineales bacterium]|nr:antibiotic biosynthesis monooxygenase [Anaerolineales bacterium]